MNRAVLTVILLCSVSLAAYAVDGEAVYTESGCDYFIVEAYMGYALLEWFGGAIPEVGDIIRGDFESYGFRDLNVVNRGRRIRVWVEDYWLSKTS